MREAPEKSGEGGDILRALEFLEERNPGPHALELAFYRRKACDWRGLEQVDARALTAIRGGVGDNKPLSSLLLKCGADDHLACAKRFTLNRSGKISALPPGTRKEGNRLRVAYLSGEYCDHPVARLVVGLFESHDRDAFEISGYSCGKTDGGRLRRRIEQACDHFYDISALSDQEGAEKIANDGADILVDLSGYTRNGRWGLCARRPAPIQVSYLGFPGTMGAGFMDYIIADSYLLPLDQQKFYTEKIVHLPECYLAGDSQRATVRLSRAELGLPRDALLLAAFNNSQKITPDLFSVWMRILRARSEAILWILAETSEIEDRLRNEAHARGIGPDRLIFARMAPFEGYMARLAAADLFLDCHPFNAGSTANDALWAGLPILTMSGRTYVSRMTGAQLSSLGLSELIVSSPEEYERLALELTRERLSAFRSILVEKRKSAALFDSRRQAEGLESLYRNMWENRRIRPGSLSRH
ncbi:hypothetical protein FACS1894205_3620 [Alphaproteobacteria bacterium]|nr:hypothetical protein FACS1894205_3620 [Alphaproteobacteria bacterium]